MIDDGIGAQRTLRSTPFASHHAISRLLAKPRSARSVMRTRGHDWRIWATMRAISSTAPALPATFLEAERYCC
jgi:hypothetical protein